MEQGKQTVEEVQDEDMRERELYSRQEGVLKLANRKVTDLATNKEVILPTEKPHQVEPGLQVFATEMKEVAKKYAKENVGREGMSRREI